MEGLNQVHTKPHRGQWIQQSGWSSACPGAVSPPQEAGTVTPSPTIKSTVKHQLRDSVLPWASSPPGFLFAFHSASFFLPFQLVSLLLYFNLGNKCERKMSDIRGSDSQIILTPEAFFPAHFPRGYLSIITLGKGLTPFVMLWVHVWGKWQGHIISASSTSVSHES